MDGLHYIYSLHDAKYPYKEFGEGTCVFEVDPEEKMHRHPKRIGEVLEIVPAFAWKKMNFQFRQISAGDVNNIITNLKPSPCLEEFILKIPQVNERHNLLKLGKWFCRTSAFGKLRNINLCRCQWTSISSACFHQVVRSTRSLEQISLNQCNLSVRDYYQLMKALIDRETPLDTLQLHQAGNEPETCYGGFFLSQIISSKALRSGFGIYLQHSANYWKQAIKYLVTEAGRVDAVNEEQLKIRLSSRNNKLKAGFIMDPNAKASFTGMW